MRITSICGSRRHFSYIGKAGKTMSPGETSPELPFATILNPVMWKDVDGNVACLKLNEEDKAFVQKLLAADQAAIPEVKPVVKVSPALERARVSQELQAKAREAQEIKEKKPTPLGTPELEDPPDGRGIPIIMAGQTAGKSLADLKKHNKVIPKTVNMAQVRVPMNPPGSAPGIPVFGKAPTAAESKEGIKNLMGGMV